MNDKARGRAGKRTKKNMTSFWVVLCALLVIAAVIAGFLYASDLIKDTDITGKKEGKVKTTENVKDIPAYDSELLFCVSPDSETIDSIVLCRLDSQKKSLKLNLIEPSLSYSMSGSLYSELSSVNIRLPQTGRFGGLLGYCSGSSAYDAGVKIAEELLAVDIMHYSVFDSRVMGEYISVNGKNGEKSISLKLGVEDAKSSEYETPGTMMGFVKKLFEKAIDSDRSVDDRLVYLEALDELKDSDIIIGKVPITKHNESMELDVQEWHRSETGKK
ncbi:MAG: hypothetical protein K6E95_00795 [Lachnospiraceae bacterium]|nr:hypothetical protein [Lachnospiraceae bacterium]